MDILKLVQEDSDRDAAGADDVGRLKSRGELGELGGWASALALCLFLTNRCHVGRGPMLGT